ncbi:hypothetical protein L1281_002536 [Neisseria sp. HSC-16F19]|nr:NERD domain-containing protein/DEAD/DEAH box helicase [Neisseria sp. HSC-16F19]MCP2041918.1 hypothetical protein [Neisseria sp. HSC-16F19]
MAVLIPSREIINKQRVAPTQGENTLLDFLQKSLNDEYEIYYQPFLNGQNPDIVLMRKGGGVLIFEVKDWNLEHYYIDQHGDWRLRKNNNYIPSPFNQVDAYKKKMQQLNYRFMYENIINKNVYGVIKTAVYFHNTTHNEILSFIENNRNNKRDKYIQIIGCDNLNKDFLFNLLHESYISRTSWIFSDELYKSIKRYLKPTFHQAEISQEVSYTPEQMQLIVSEQGKKQKIKGSAGSGKTLVLAKRAVNAHLRTNSPILILTFNISLINYIHDQISKVKENFAWENFYISNYHSFFKEYAEVYGLSIQEMADYDNEDFFESRKDGLVKFEAIFIDEIQDYKQEWLNLVINYFSNDKTEIVVFGDEKQNIYNRELDKNKEIKITGIPGAWNRSLKKSFRFKDKIGKLAIKFQQEFLEQKYGTHEMLIEQQEFDFEPSIIEYHEINDENLIVDIVFSFIEKYDIHSNDVAILSDKINIVREVDFKIRDRTHEDTMTTFETKEEYNSLVSMKLTSLKEELNKIRRAKKHGFWLNAGMLKISTIKSFKGWEIHTAFLVIDENSTGELIYTGITRARQNLIVINLGNLDYSDFFERNINK